MKDKTLHSFRRTPDNTYTETLLQRLERIPETAVPPTIQPARPRRMRLAWAIVPLVLMFFLLAAAPGVRARFEDIIRQVGGLTFLITEAYPGGDDTPGIVPNDSVTLQEGRDRLDFEFSLPGYLPEGLVLQEDTIEFLNLTGGLMMTWLDEEQRARHVSLYVQEANADVNRVVGPDSVTEVMVNDTAATIIHGGWNGDTKTWDDFGVKELRWHLDGVEYQLSTLTEENGGLSDAELIQIAESIQPSVSGIR